MRSKTQRTGGGRHRKITTSQTAKGRLALVTVAAGAASTAGMGGAAAAQLQSNAQEDTKAQSVDFTLANDSTPVVDANAQIEEAANNAQASIQNAIDSVPQILALAEAKPVTNLDEQLDKAIQASEARAEADLAARAPSVVAPTEGAFTSGFGPRWGSFHAGIDIANVNGTPILAVMDGTVIDSGPASGYGNWIRIQHDDGSVSVYGHMDTLNVTVGERVRAGQNIAGMGNQGFSTGTHLHFEIHPGGGAAVDPVAWFAERGVTIA